MSRDSFEVKDTRRIGGRDIAFWSLARFADRGFEVERLPWSLRILLENLLRNEDGVAVEPADVEALARWDPAAEPSHEIAFRPARVLQHLARDQEVALLAQLLHVAEQLPLLVAGAEEAPEQVVEREPGPRLDGPGRKSLVEDQQDERKCANAHNRGRQKSMTTSEVTPTLCYGRLLFCTHNLTAATRLGNSEF